MLGAAGLSVAAAWPLPSRALTLEEVTPSIAPVGPLTDREAAIINIFESSSVAVANVFDVTLLVSIVAQQVLSRWSPPVPPYSIGCAP